MKLTPDHYHAVMRKFLLPAFALVCSSIAAESEKPTGISQPIPELKLTNGAVFRQVTIVRYEKDRVVLKSLAGTGPLAYSYIPEPLRSQMIAERDAQPTTQPKKSAPTTKEITGQMFVTTAGAGAYKFAGFVVKFYAKTDYDSALWHMKNNLPSANVIAENRESVYMDAWVKALADYTPVAQTTSDADGRFKVTLPADAETFIFTGGSRVVGKYREWDLWVTDSPASGEIILSNGNMW